MSRKKFYVGITHLGKREVFSSSITPTEESHGRFYSATIGPFQTKRGALFMAEHGQNNPHVQTVEDAEYYAYQEVVRRALDQLEIDASIKAEDEIKNEYEAEAQR